MKWIVIKKIDDFESREHFPSIDFTISMSFQRCANIKAREDLRRRLAMLARNAS